MPNFQYVEPKYKIILEWSYKYIFDGNRLC